MEKIDAIMLSGGIDSAVLAAELVGEKRRGGDPVPLEAFFVDYGQKAKEAEWSAAVGVARYLDLPLHRFKIPSLQVSEISTNVYFGRNSLFVLNLVNVALQMEKSLGVIHFGFTKDDQADYADCRDEWIRAIHAVLGVYMGGPEPVVVANYSRKTKAEVIELGNKIFGCVQIEACWSCYESGPTPCGACASCLLRAASMPKEGDGEMLTVHEVFDSIQGEGPRVGLPTTFVRFQGCSVGCGWCDTKGSWGKRRGDSPVDGGDGRCSPGSLMAWTLVLHASHVCLTGGEPLQQPRGPLRQFIEKLLAAGKEVSLETSGVTGDLGMYPLSRFVQVVLSPKPHAFDLIPPSFGSGCVLKVVIACEEDEIFLRKCIERFRPVETFVQPVWGSKEMEEFCVSLVKSSKWSGMPRPLRLSLQTHKYLGIR